MEQPSLNGQWALVTGASKGIGFGIAEQLVGAGANVVLVARNVDALDEAEAQLRDGAESAQELVVRPCDTSDRSAISELFGWVRSELPGLNVLVANALAQVKGGKLRGLAVTSQKRSPLAPDVPAIAEELPGYELIAWFALVAPAGTPQPIVTRLHDVTVKSLAKPDVADRFAKLGTDVAPMNPEQLGAFIRSEIDKWAKMAKAAGIQPE